MSAARLRAWRLALVAALAAAALVMADCGPHPEPPYNQRFGMTATQPAPGGAQ